jgi:hypothetical protein
MGVLPHSGPLAGTARSMSIVARLLLVFIVIDAAWLVVIVARALS